ncbi:MAG: hypothetical protein JWM10_4964 [Myxococcaceae bacterium]|nr:hypothetical protein [Myxococcaceae bacterium]
MTSTRWIVGTLLVALGAVGMGGCYYDFDDDRDDTPPPSSYGSTAPSNATRWTAQADTFRGDLGNVQGFGGMTATVAGSDYGTTSSSVRIDAENPAARWWAMTQLSVSGSLHHRALVPGAHLVFGSGSRTDRITDGAAGLYVSALGCSGPRLNQYTYDRGAEEVVVDVSAGPTADTRRFTFDAKFAGPNGEQHVTGSFVFDNQ